MVADKIIVEVRRLEHHSKQHRQRPKFIAIYRVRSAAKCTVRRQPTTNIQLKKDFLPPASDQRRSVNVELVAVLLRQVFHMHMQWLGELYTAESDSLLLRAALHLFKLTRAADRQQTLFS